VKQSLSLCMQLILAVLLVMTWALAYGQTAQTPSNPLPPHTRSATPLTSHEVTTSDGTPGTIPVFSTATDIENSPVVVYDGNIGIGTTAPSSALEVASVVRHN
jgi:hypothetical protein